MKYNFFLGLILTLLTLQTYAEESLKSKYAGQESRKIKSLSQADIKELQRGGGWGLAKAAELNGYPGPAHILEMKDKINLSDKQELKIQSIYNEMKVEAIQLGKQLILLEIELNNAFSNKTINQSQLEKLVQDIEKTRAELRLVHLSKHLQTPDVLSNEQIALYNKLRGYSKDPCQNVPEGHDEQMWKAHNGCQ